MISDRNRAFLLAVDIGNTNIVAGVFCGEDLLARWRIATDGKRMPDEYAVLLQSLFRLAGLDGSVLLGAVVAGVVPGAQSALCDAIRSYWNTEPFIVSPQADLGIEVRAQGAGADRIANSIAALQRYGSPAIVVDFGTGTNFDVVSRDGAYLGGAIAPGLEIAEEALVSRTAQLPHVPLISPPSAIGNTTITALQSGIVFGYAGLVDGLVRRIDKELGGGAHVIATGGLAEVIAPHTETVKHVDLDLTLVGLQLLYARNTGVARP
jgi:type III pantothenate kinase